MKCYKHQIFLNLMEDLSLHSMQVTTVSILFDVVLAMLQSIRSKYETKKKLIAISSLMILLKELIIFLASFLQLNLRN